MHVGSYFSSRLIPNILYLCTSLGAFRTSISEGKAKMAYSGHAHRFRLQHRVQANHRAAVHPPVPQTPGIAGGVLKAAGEAVYG